MGNIKRIMLGAAHLRCPSFSHVAKVTVECCEFRGGMVPIDHNNSNPDPVQKLCRNPI